MHIQTDRALIPARIPSVRYLHVVISAPPAPPRTGAATPRSPASVALVLDRSGSMGGTKIAMARTAVQQAVQLLTPQDHLAVVCYDDQVDTVLARTAASPEAKTLALDRLALIDARGSTDLEGGWMRGAKELGAAPEGQMDLPAESPDTQTGQSAEAPDARRRVLLLTDGLANRGVTDPQLLAATAARLRTQGITTSTFGVGADFDEQLLARVAGQGGGHFYFIEQPQQIPDLLASELGESLEVVARDVVFEIAGGPGVDLGVLNELPTDAAPGVLRVRLGDLVAEQEVTLVVAVGVRQPPAVGEQVAVQCRLSDRDHMLYAQPLTVDWPVVEPAAHDGQPVNPQVLAAVATLLAARARAMALVANRRGEFDEARRILQDMVKTLTALAPGNPEAAAVIAGLEEERVYFQEAMSPLDMKRRHFASYAIAESRAPGGRARRRPSVS
jgi:Ca-activated chloride channel family protein